MAILLKQSTASQEIPLGYLLDSTDGDTAETGLTIANTDIKIWKTGATTLADKNSGGATHIAGGIYYAVLDATDTDTLGPLVVFCHVSGALALRVECLVLPANVYDSLVAGTDLLQADLQQWIGVAPLALTSQKVQGHMVSAATDALDAAAVKADAVTKIQSGLATGTEISALNNLSQAESQAAATAALEAENLHRLIKDALDTDWGTTVTQNSVLGMMASKNGFNTFDRTTDSLEAAGEKRADLDTDIAALAATLANVALEASITAISNKLGPFTGAGTDDLRDWLLALLSKDAPAPGGATGTFDPATDSVEAIRNTAPLGTAMRGTDNALLASGYTAPPTVGQIADQVWDEALAGHAGAGSAGAALSGATAPTAGQVADAVWDEAAADHNTAGSTGQKLNAAGAAADPLLNEVPGAYAEGTAGYILGNNVPAIKAKTDLISAETTINVLTALSGDTINVRRGDSWVIAITGLGSLAGRTKLWFTLKRSTTDADSAALVQIEESAGLAVLNGAAAATPAQGNITVDDEAAGDITIRLDEAASAALAPTGRSAAWDVQVLNAGSVSTLTTGDANISADVTRAVA